MLGTGELLVIAAVAIIVVDPKKLPDLMKGLGKAIGEFKQMSGEVKRTIERESEMADFEKRKAEAEQQLFGDKAAPAPESPSETPAPAEAQGEQPEPQPAPEHVEQPPVQRLDALQEEQQAAPEAPAPTEADLPPAPPASDLPPAPAQGDLPPVPSEAELPPVPPASELSPVPSGDELPPVPAEGELPPLPAGEGEKALAPQAEALAPAAFEAAAPPASPPPPPPPPPPLSGDEAVGEGQSGRMSLFGHLAELRKGLTRSAIAVLVGFLGCYAFAGRMLKILMQPMLDALKQSHFIYTIPTEAFFAEMWIAFIAGMFAASPYIFYQIWGFVAPGLYSHERRWIIPIAMASALFFVCGALFGYFVVFPFGFEFFASYTSDILVFTPKLDEYLGFVLKLLFAFGLVFELPLFLFFLSRLGIVSHVGLRKKRKYAILVSFIVAAALTPPDAISQTMMAVPLCILYELGIWVAFFFGKKPKPKPEDEAPAEGAAA